MKLTTATLLGLVGAASAGSLLQSADIASPGSYVIKLKSSADKASLAKVASAFNAEKKYTIGRSFKGFAASLTAEQLEEVLANDAVDIVSPNVRVYTTGILDAKIFNAPNVTAKAVAQNGCPDSQTGVDTVDLSWGQARVTSPSLDTYLHDAAWGTGVDVYVTDTGTLCAHAEFNGRTCTCGPDFSGFIGGPDMTGGCADGNGHGTFCSSIAAGNVYGIAKSANIIGVKVMGDAGAGSLNSIVDGFNWVAEQAAATGKPSVCSVSLGTQGTNALVDAAANALAEVAPTAIAAGNSGNMIDRLANTCTGSSPGAAEIPITVGSSDIVDARSYFSNYGPCNDVFARAPPSPARTPRARTQRTSTSPAPARPWPPRMSPASSQPSSPSSPRSPRRRSRLRSSPTPRRMPSPSTATARPASAAWRTARPPPTRSCTPSTALKTLSSARAPALH
jgi:cerevisin